MSYPYPQGPPGMPPSYPGRDNFLGRQGPPGMFPGPQGQPIMSPLIPPARERSPGLSFDEMYPGRQKPRGISPAPPQSRGSLFLPQPPVVYPGSPPESRGSLAPPTPPFLSPSPPQFREYLGRQQPRGMSPTPPESRGSLAPPEPPGMSPSPPQFREYVGRQQPRGISPVPPASPGSIDPPQPPGMSPSPPQFREYLGRQQPRGMSPTPPESRGSIDPPQPPGMSPSPPQFREYLGRQQPRRISPAPPESRGSIDPPQPPRMSPSPPQPRGYFGRLLRGRSPAPPESRGSLAPPQPLVASPSPPQLREYFGRQGSRGISPAPPEPRGSIDPPQQTRMSPSPPQSRGYFGQLLRGRTTAPPESRGSLPPPQPLVASREYFGRQGSRGISPAPPESRGSLAPPQPPVASPSPPQSHEYVGRQGSRGISPAPLESPRSLAPPQPPVVSPSPPQSRGYFGRQGSRGISPAPPESRGSIDPPQPPRMSPSPQQSRGYFDQLLRGRSTAPPESRRSLAPPQPPVVSPSPPQSREYPGRQGPRGMSPAPPESFASLEPLLPPGMSPGTRQYVGRQQPRPKSPESRRFLAPSQPSGISPNPPESGASPLPPRRLLYFGRQHSRAMSPAPPESRGSVIPPQPREMTPSPSRSPSPSRTPSPSRFFLGPSRSPGPSGLSPVPIVLSPGPSGLSPGPSGLSPGPSGLSPGPSKPSPSPTGFSTGPSGFFAPSQPREMPPAPPEPPPVIFPGTQNEPAAHYAPSQVDAPVSFVYEPLHPTGGSRSAPPTPSPWAPAEENPPHQGFVSWPSTPEPIYPWDPPPPRGPRVYPVPVFFLPLGHTVDPPPSHSVDPPTPPKPEPRSWWPPRWWVKLWSRTPKRYIAAEPDYSFDIDRVRARILYGSDVDHPVYFPDFEDSYDDFHSRSRVDSYYIPHEYQSRTRGSSFLIPPEYRDLRPKGKPECCDTGTLISVILCVLVLTAISVGLYFALGPKKDELGSDASGSSGIQRGNGTGVHTYFLQYCSNHTRRKRAWVVEYDDKNRADDIGRKAMMPESNGGTLHSSHDHMHGRHIRYARDEGKTYNTSIQETVNAYWMDGDEEGSAIADAASSNSGTKRDTDLRKNGAREGIINTGTMKHGNIKVKHQVVQPPGVGKASVGTSQTMQAPKRSDSFTWSNSSVDETGVADDDGRSFITGGVRAQCSQHPYAAIIRNGAGTDICSGTLVDNKHVLTTASCFMKNKTRTQAGMNTTDLVPHADNYTVYLGYLTLDFSCMTTPVMSAVKFVYVHSMNDYHDIALVGLAVEIRLSDSVSPVCLAGAQDVMNFETCQAVGFGISNASSEAALRQAPNAIWLTWGDCLRSDEISGLIRAQLPSRVNASFNKYMEDKLCSLVGDNGTGLCEGDVGGQLLCDSVVRREQKLFGIHLPVTDQCGKPGSLLLGTSVQYHLVWLEFVAVRFLNDMFRNDTETLINYNCRFSYCKDHLKAAIDEASRKTRESHDASTDPGANEPAMDVDDLVNTHRRPREANPPGSLTPEDLCRWYVAYYKCRGIGSPKSELICNRMDRTVTPGLLDAFDILLENFLSTGRHRYCAPPPTTTTRRPKG